MYLMKYGYMDEVSSSPRSASLLHPDVMRNSIAEFQRFAGLAETGDLDDVTLEWMQKPRCGVKDLVGHGATAKRKKRYALQGKSIHAFLGSNN